MTSNVINQSRERERELDQFYTNPLIADELINVLFELLPNLKDNTTFLEPSAGTGNFIVALQNARSG